MTQSILAKLSFIFITFVYDAWSNDSCFFIEELDPVISNYDFSHIQIRKIKPHKKKPNASQIYTQFMKPAKQEEEIYHFMDHNGIATLAIVYKSITQRFEECLCKNRFDFNKSLETNVDDWPIFKPVLMRAMAYAIDSIRENEPVNLDIEESAVQILEKLNELQLSAPTYAFLDETLGKWLLEHANYFMYRGSVRDVLGRDHPTLCWSLIDENANFSPFLPLKSLALNVKKDPLTSEGKYIFQGNVLKLLKDFEEEAKKLEKKC